MRARIVSREQLNEIALKMGLQFHIVAQNRINGTKNIVGSAKAFELSTLGSKVTAEEALRLGMSTEEIHGIAKYVDERPADVPHQKGSPPSHRRGVEHLSDV